MITSTFDRAGVTLSALCIVHCLLLPLTTSFLPLMGVLAENETIHKALVLLAIIPAAFAFTDFNGSKSPFLIAGLGVIGVISLLMSAFIEAFHDYEAILTLVGAVILASAHIVRIRANKHHPHEN